MGWVTRGRRQASTPTPVGPPDPEAVRRQLAAERAARLRAMQEFVAQRVLPRINAALQSVDFVSYEVGHLSIHGSRTHVSVCEVGGMTDWIAPLLQALRQPPYAGYALKFRGSYRTGAHPRSARPSHREVDLNAQDIPGSTKKFREDHAGRHVYFEVVISL